MTSRRNPNGVDRGMVLAADDGTIIKERPLRLPLADDGAARRLVIRLGSVGLGKWLASIARHSANFSNAIVRSKLRVTCKSARNAGAQNISLTLRCIIASKTPSITVAC